MNEGQARCVYTFPLRTLQGCNDLVWPDGKGSFALDSATAPTVEELLTWDDQFDWSAGVLIRTVRAARHASSHAKASAPRSPAAGATHAGPGCAMVNGPHCLLELASGGEGREPFGFNWTAPASPLDHPWTHFSSEELGTRTLESAHPASRRAIPGGGYVVGFIPFMSDVLLPEQRGPAWQVIDFRNHTSRGFHGRCVADSSHDCEPRFHCVRLTWNGAHLHQLCDPGDAAGRTTGVVRAAVEELWNDLKRGHFLDAESRALVISLQVDVNALALSSYSTLTFELTGSGAVLPAVTTSIAPARVDEALVYAPRSLQPAHAIMFVFMLAVLVNG
eukprot:6077126-Prymnesium_polylepis.2